MAVREAILGLLASGELHGYELKRRLEFLLQHFWTVDFGQLYRHLAALERDGLVEKRIQHQEMRPDRKIYRITPRGRDVLRAWMDQPNESRWRLQSEFYLKLALWSQVPHGDLRPHLDAQERAYGAYRDELERILAAHDDSRDHPLMLLAEVGLRHAEVELEWLAQVRRRLGGT